MAISRKRAACSSRPALRVPGRANVRRQPRAALVRWLRRFPTPPLRPALIGTTALTMAALCGSGAALAGPTGGVVTAGEAEIIYGDGTVTIEQQSDRVIIEWESYNVGAGESVHYNQPHELAELLNIVLGGHSQIDGTITANGRIFIANSAGITFGAEANVNVESIIAAALDVMDRDRFMAGDRLEFAVGETGDPTAVVENYGTITAHGMAALVGPAARNSGTIAADVTVIGGGEGVALDYYGDGLINFEITRPTTVRPIGSDGQPVEALVVNDGTILSDGGTVILTADAAAGVIDNVINLDGVVQARSVASRDGQVVLLGGEDGAVTVAGTIDATGDDAGEAGGTVHVLGDTVVLAEGADIDVSGQAGGGTALIGGDYLGGPLQPGGHIAYATPEEGAGGTRIAIDPVEAFETDGHIPTADIAYFAEGASVTADATVDGDGGRVILWADEATQFSGAISVRGGAEGGDGGFVETSGGINLGVAASASVDALAPNGDVGDWLLDPRSVTIQTGGGATLLQIADAADTTNDLVVDPATLNAALANVSIVASETITVTDAVSIAASGVGLTATAGTSITVNADVTTNNGDITFVTDGLAINAAVNAGTAGVAIRRATAGNIGLGSIVWGQLDVSQLELARITAATLTVGGSNTIQLDVADVDTTLTITGTVTLRALHDVSSATYLWNTNVFNALHTESNLAYVWGTQSLNDGPGSLPLAERTWTAVGGSLGSPSTVYIEGVIDTNGGAAHFAVGSGGDFWVVGPEDAVVTDGGTVTVVADVVTLNTATPATPAIDAGSGQVIFRRDTDGTMSVGDDNGGVHISQGELDVIAAGTLTVGAAASGDSHTTGVTVSTADLTGFGTVNLNALTAPGTITVAGPVSTAAGGGGLTATASGSITVDDTLTTNNGDVTFVTDSLAINAAVDAGTGGVAIRRAAHGSGIVTVGALGVGLSITQAEVDRITAASLSIGGSNTDAIYAEDLDATAISGPVSLNALYDGTTSTVQLIGSNTFNALDVEAGDGAWVWDTLTLNDGAGALPLADRTLTVVVRSENGPGSIDLYGVVDTNGGSATLTALDGGQLRVHNAESALLTDGGTVTVTADQVTLNPATPSSPAIDAGAGEIIFRRSTDGAISLGEDHGGMHLSQGELDVMSAGTMTVGASGAGQTTVVNTKGADLDAFGTVDLDAPIGLSDPVPDDPDSGDPDSGAEMPEGTDPGTLMPDIRRRESAGDRAGGAAFFSNELGAPFQADVFSETFDLVEFDDPDGGLGPPVEGVGGLLRRPTVGSGEPGNQGDLPTAPGDDAGRPGNVLQTPTDRTDAWDEEDDIGEVTGPDDLGELNASAGAGDQQAEVETCVAAFLGEVWDAAATCQ